MIPGDANGSACRAVSFCICHYLDLLALFLFRWLCSLQHHLILAYENALSCSIGLFSSVAIRWNGLFSLGPKPDYHRQPDRIGERHCHRLPHFIKMAADQRKVWGLWDDGWAMAGTDDKVDVFPLWPAQEYAASCALDSWFKYQPCEIDLDSLFNELLPDFSQKGILVGIFTTPQSRSITPDLKQFESDLKQELSRIE